jgi:hypothetical protein
MSIKTGKMKRSVRVTLDEEVVKYFDSHEEQSLSGTANTLLKRFVSNPVILDNISTKDENQPVITKENILEHVEGYINEDPNEDEDDDVVYNETYLKAHPELIKQK